MKRSSIVAIFLAFILISISLSLVPSKRFNDILISSSTVLAAIGSIATLWVALLLYDRFKIDQNLFDKQGEKVIALLVMIRQKSFGIEIEGKGTFHLHLFNINKTGLSNQFKELASKMSSQGIILLFNHLYLKSLLDVYRMSHDIYLPKIISDKIEEYSIIYNLKVDEDPDKTYGKVRPTNPIEESIVGLNDPKEIDPNSWSLVLTRQTLAAKEKGTTFNDFIDEWIDIVSTIEDWIRENAPSAAGSLGIVKGKTHN